MSLERPLAADAITGFPRPRGDEPEAARLVNLDATFSPPARG